MNEWKLTLKSIPLHGVLWSKNTEFTLENSNVLGVVEKVGVGNGTKVLLALSNHSSMKTSGSWITGRLGTTVGSGGWGR